MQRKDFKMIFADYHTHSSFSTDSQIPMEDMIKRAISLGLTTICFTDHMDYDFPYGNEGTFTFSPISYVSCIKELQELYKNQICICMGIELGMQPHLVTKCQELIYTYPFDFVICSSHLVNGIDPYNKEFWTDSSEKSIKDSITSYFQSIIDNLLVYTDFDVYGHLDYIIRYIPCKSFAYHTSDYWDLIDVILKRILSIQKGIEINTAGYKYGLEEPNPTTTIIKRYLELGGEIITIGSDGHCPEHLAYAFDKAETLLSSLGVKYYTIFKDRKPEWIPIR